MVLLLGVISDFQMAFMDPNRLLMTLVCWRFEEKKKGKKCSLYHVYSLYIKQNRKGMEAAIVLWASGQY
jgi:hypothetical protein